VQALSKSYDRRVIAERRGLTLGRRRRPASPAPRIELGALVEGGLAPAILAVVERGITHRPALAATLDAEVELSTGGDYPPVRIRFGPDRVLIEDGPAADPDLRITGSLPDLVSLMVAPLVGGVPSPMQPRGRAALGMVARRRVRVEGRIGLMRRFLGLIKV
jgi:hypothetical protein